MTNYVDTSVISTARRVLAEAASVNGARPMGRPRSRVKAKDAVEALRPAIERAIRAGLNIRDVISMLRESGVTLAEPTLYAYVRSVRA